jgi:hypothetical protein
VTGRRVGGGGGGRTCAIESSGGRERKSRGRQICIVPPCRGSERLVTLQDPKSAPDAPRAHPTATVVHGRARTPRAPRSALNSTIRHAAAQRAVGRACDAHVASSETEAMTCAQTQPGPPQDHGAVSRGLGAPWS